MGSIFSTVKTNMAAKPGVLITSLLLQLEAIPNLKWSYKASRVYVTSNNSVSSEVIREIAQFSTFVRKITLILDISSVPFL